MNVPLQRMRWWHIAPILPIEEDLFGAEHWSPRLFWSELAQADTRWYLVAAGADGDVLAYGGLCAYPDEGYVQNLAVRRDQQGRGLGRQLLVALLREAARRGLETVGLEVRADNDVARRLYGALGFVPVAVRRGYYQPSNTDAVVMLPAGLQGRDLS